MHRIIGTCGALFATSIVLLTMACATPPAPAMTQRALADGIREIAGDARVDQNVVEFEYQNVCPMGTSQNVRA